MTFALVTEGISEHRIIKHILYKYFKEQEPDINQMQPKLTDDEKKQEDGSIGGWVEVLKYCEDENELESIFIENEYLIIQIDTDVCEIEPFSVSRKNKDNCQLHSDIIDRIINTIPKNIKDRHLDKIIFAICINTIECWLLPLFYVNNYKCKTTNCLYHLNSALAKKNMDTISSVSEKNSPNSQKAYYKILNTIKRSDDIEQCSMHNFGFKYFISQLSKIKIPDIVAMD